VTPLLAVTADDITDHRLGLRLLRQAERAGHLQLSLVLVDGETSAPEDEAGLLRQHLLSATSPVTVLCLGAPTALAAVIVETPSVTRIVERAVLLGGASFAGGDVTPAAERAVHGNPVAYQVVLTSGLRNEMVPLDVSDHVTSELAAALQDDRPPVEASDSERDRERYPNGTPLRSATALLWLLAPSLFKGRDVHVTVETASAIARGVTSVDWWQTTDAPHNAHYVGKVDVEGARARLDAMMRTLEGGPR